MAKRKYALAVAAVIAGVAMAGLLPAVRAADDATASAPATKPVALKKVPADEPSPKMDPKTGQVQAAFAKTHDKYVARAKKGDIDLYFEGDSITANWVSARGKEVWAKEFSGYKSADFGIGGDRTEHVLWRMDNGELDGLSPKVVVLMIGTNNTSNCTSEEIAGGVAAIVKKFREKTPDAHILLLAIFPRGDVKTDNPTDKRRKINEGANELIAKLDDGDHVKFLNINDKFPAVGTPEFEKDFPDATHLHPGPEGYQIWADAIKPYLRQYLGEPAATTPAPATMP